MRKSGGKTLVFSYMNWRFSHLQSVFNGEEPMWIERDYGLSLPSSSTPQIMIDAELV